MTRSYLASEAYSDLIIKCSDIEFKMHKAIVCAQMKFFGKHCEKRWGKKKMTGASQAISS